MKTIKHLFLLVCTAACFAACTKDKEFDHKAQFTADTTLIRKFVTENNIPNVKKDKSGIFYQIINPGEGTVVYTQNTAIKAEYEGKLLNGTMFDNGGGKAIDFSLGGVIPGWQIGIPLIQKGGEIRFFVPSLLAYQNSASGPIPANSVLDFKVKLIDAK